MSAHQCWLDTFLNNKCPIAFLPLSFQHLALHEEDIGSQAQRALIKHQETRWGQIWGQTVDLKVTKLNVLLACSVFAWLWVCEWDTHTSPQRWDRNVCNPHVSQLCGGMFVHICENLTYEHTHRHAAMWNARSAGWLAWLWCQVAVGVPVCDPGISVFVLCHSPSLWGDDSPVVPEGMKPEIGRA